jgi:hypothetical protein
MQIQADGGQVIEDDLVIRIHLFELPSNHLGNAELQIGKSGHRRLADERHVQLARGRGRKMRGKR